MKNILLCCLSWFAFSAFAQYPKANIAFTIPEKGLIAEGIAYDERSETFYTGSISKRKIVAITKDGKVRDFIARGQDNMGEVLGMKVVNNYLWACNNNAVDSRFAVHQYDLQTGKLVNMFTIANDGKAHLLNDLVVHSSGKVYISDSKGSAVFELDPAKGTMEKLIESDEFRFANGITLSPDGNKVITCTARGLMQVDPATKKTSLIGFRDYYILGIDGMYRYENSLIGIQNVTFPISINRYYFNKEATGIERAEILNAEDPLYAIPTTGVIVKDFFYFIANSQLEFWDDDKSDYKPNAVLKETIIARIKMR